MDYFESLDPVLRIFWFIAIPSSLIFLIQTILTFVGMDGSEGVEVDIETDFDHDGMPFQLFSFRNLINFMLGFGWTGVSFYHLISSTYLLIFVAFGMGCLFVGVFFLVIKQIQKLAEDNSFKISLSLNKVGEVYLTIPEKKSGKGKVQVSVKGAYHELDAVTENEKIESGASVKIIKVEGSNLVVVERI